MSTSIPTPRMQPSPFVEQFKVLVRDKLFTLSRTQIEFDSPNYFTAAFLGEYSEAASKTIHVDCHPTIFSLIKDYLSGDGILPLRKEIIPATMTLDRARENLIANAQFLGLDKLESLLHPVLVEDITEAMINTPLGQLLLDHCKDSHENIKFLLLRNTGLTINSLKALSGHELEVTFKLTEKHRVLLAHLLPYCAPMPNSLVWNEPYKHSPEINYHVITPVRIDSWSGNLWHLYQFCAGGTTQTEGLRREFSSFSSNERLPLIVEEALVLMGKGGTVLSVASLKAKNCETAMNDFLDARSDS